MGMLAYVNRNVLPMIGLSILHWIAWLVFAKPFMLYRRHYTVSLLRAHTKRLLVMGWTRPTQTRPWAGYGPRCGPIHLNGPCGGEATASSSKRLHAGRPAPRRRRHLRRAGVILVPS